MSTHRLNSTVVDPSGEIIMSFLSLLLYLCRCKCSNCSLERITKPEECWCCMDMDRCTERMLEVDKEGECITAHPGYAACCLNSWVLSSAAISLKTSAKSPTVL